MSQLIRDFLIGVISSIAAAFLLKSLSRRRSRAMACLLKKALMLPIKIAAVFFEVFFALVYPLIYPIYTLVALILLTAIILPVSIFDALKINPEDLEVALCNIGLLFLRDIEERKTPYAIAVILRYGRFLDFALRHEVHALGRLVRRRRT